MQNIDNILDVSSLVKSDSPGDIELKVALAKSPYSSPFLLDLLTESNDRVVLANLISNKNIDPASLERVRTKLSQ